MPHETLGMLNDPDAPAPENGRKALVSLLAHIAAAHGGVDDDELAFLARLDPGADKQALRTSAEELGSQPLDLAGLRAAWPELEDRYAVLDFAVRMAWKDGDVQAEERNLLHSLREGLALPTGSVDRSIHAMAGQGGGASAGDLTNILEGVVWHAVDLELEAPTRAELTQAAGDATPVARVEVDEVEIMGLYQEGVAAFFREGVAFLRWSDIVTYSRVQTLAASIALRTEDGRAFNLVDRRLAGLALVLDRLFATKRRAPKGDAPVVVQLRGEDDKGEEDL